MTISPISPILIAALALIPTLALAASPPAGSEDDQLLSPYGPALRQAMPDAPDGTARPFLYTDSCCSTADGTAVDARPTNDGGWEVKFRNDRFPDAPKGWIKVPKEKVLHHWRNPSGLPLVWWFSGQIRCFGPPDLS